MTYSPYPVPLRTALFDAQGRLAKPWIDFLAAMGRKAGRSLTWMGDYDSTRAEYAVGDVVRHSDEWWLANQANPVNGTAVEPGTDDTVWEFLLAPLPPKGTKAQILAKKSDTDYDVDWEDSPSLPPGGTEGQVLAKASDLDFDTEWVDGSGSPGPPGPAGPPGAPGADGAAGADGAPGVGVPAGGTTGQVLAKVSDDDYDTTWDDAAGGSGTPSDTVEALDGTGAAGTATEYSRGDHKHEDTARHTHSNKTTLDAITAAYTTAEATKLGALPDAATLASDLAAKLDDTQLDTDGTLAANSDTRIATQKATKTYADTKVAPALPGAIGITIDGGLTTPATGSKGFVQVPYSGTITGWTLIADQSGSAQITVKKCAYGSFPSTTSIVASLPPKLTSQQNNTSTTLTGWTTAVTAGDVFEFNLDSVTTCLRLTLEAKVTKA